MKKGVLALFIFVFLFFELAIGGEPYMPSYKDSMVFMVHGINSFRYTWSDPDDKGQLSFDDSNKWGGYLKNDLQIPKDYLKAYSFSEKSGYNEQNMLEFGLSGYDNPGSYDSAPNNQDEIDGIPKTTGITRDSGNTWIKQAQSEYRALLYNNSTINPIGRRGQLWFNESDIPTALLPKKLVMLAHSQGNFATRGYIQSGALMEEKGYFTGQGMSDIGVSTALQEQIHANPLGFYTWPVEKVVFINPVLRGSSVRWYVLFRALSILQKALSNSTLGNMDNVSGIESTVRPMAMISNVMGMMAAVGSEDDLDQMIAQNETLQWLIKPIFSTETGFPIDIPIYSYADVIVYVGNEMTNGFKESNAFILLLQTIASKIMNPKGPQMTAEEIIAFLNSLNTGIENFDYKETELYDFVLKVGSKNFPGQSILDCLQFAATYSSDISTITGKAFASTFPSIGDKSMNGNSNVGIFSWSIFLLFIGSIVDSKRKIFRNTLVSVV